MLGDVIDLPGVCWVGELRSGRGSLFINMRTTIHSLIAGEGDLGDHPHEATAKIMNYRLVYNRCIAIPEAYMNEGGLGSCHPSPPAKKKNHLSMRGLSSYLG